MRKVAFLYTLIMASTLVWVPYQLPIPKIGGEFEAGYHLTCGYHGESGFACKQPYVQAEDSKLLDRVLSYLKLEKLSEKNIPVKYRVNYAKLVAEWLFITFLTLVWMLAFRFSKSHNNARKKDAVNRASS